MNATASNQPAKAQASKTYSLKVSYKLFHHSQGGQFATCNAAVTPNHRVRLSAIKLDEDALRKATKGGIVHDWTLANFQKLVREAVLRLVNDTDGMRYPIRWNDETCLECQFTSNAELSDSRPKQPTT